MSTTVTSRSDEPGIVAPTMLRCRICKQPYHERKAICSRCGTPLSPIRQTLQIMPVLEDSDTAEQPRGAAFASPQKPIILQLNDRLITLPMADEIVIGRFSGEFDDAAPDIDLSPLGAMEAGVSRRHVRITNRNNLIYASDLGSSNGTWINRHRLFAHTERPLRNGDELRLGKLKISVIF